MTPFHRKPRPPAAWLAVLAVTLGCNADQAPEATDDPPPACTGLLAIGDTVTGTVSPQPDVPQQCAFAASAGQELIAYLQATGGQPPGALFLRVLWDIQGVEQDLGWILSAADVGDLEASATGRFLIPQTDTFRLTVNATGPPANSNGPFRALLREVNRAPEASPVTILVGDTADGEAIQYVGDVDEFLLQGAAQDTVNLFFQALSSGDRARLLLGIGPDGDRFARVESAPPDSPLTRGASGHVRLDTGAILLTVRGRDEKSNGDRGPYRIWAWRVHSPPESLPPAFSLGDSLLGEAIDRPGDVDDFSLTLVDSALHNLAIKSVPNGDILRALFLEAGSESVIWELPHFHEATGRVLTPPGSYTLRLRGDRSTGDGYQGPYELRSYAIDPAPEIAAPTLAPGDTVTGEAIDPVGDLDVFTLAAPAHPMVLLLQGTGSPSEYGFVAALGEPGGGEAIVAVCSRTSEATLAGQSSGRFELPRAGDFAIAVTGGNAGRLLAEAGPYRLAVLPFPTVPETASPDVAVGAAVSTEAIDSRGDLDAFSVTAAPGLELQVFFEASAAAVRLDAVDPATPTVLRGTPAGAPTGRFSIPSGGAVALKVFEPRFPGGCREDQAFLVPSASYRFEVVAIDRHPETADASIALGDTVETEAIDVIGDIDEFTFDGIAGTSVVASLQTPSGFDGTGDLLLEVLTVDRDSTLAALTSHNPTPDLGSQSTRPFVLPATGTYLVRVQSTDDRSGIGTYRFRIVGGT